VEIRLELDLELVDLACLACIVLGSWAESVEDTLQAYQAWAGTLDSFEIRVGQAEQEMAFQAPFAVIPIAED
jgi:hypothetical protein